MALVLNFTISLALVLILEQLRQIFQGLLFPAVMDIRMNAVFGGKLVNGFSSFRISSTICTFWLTEKCFRLGMMNPVYTLFLHVSVSSFC